MFRWRIAVPCLVAVSACAIVALRLDLPAFDVARTCFALVAAILAAKVLMWVAVAGERFGREERLLAFVMLASIALGWVGAGEWLSDRAFDYRAAQQKAEFMRALHETSVRISRFVDARDRVAPPHPRPATWQQDVAEFERFESDTVNAYERRFGSRVRAEHDLASLRGLRDRDLDAFFRHPSNEFQMRVIAKKLETFSGALARR